MDGAQIVLQMMDDNIKDPEELKKMRTAFLKEELEWQANLAKALDPYGGHSGTFIAVVIFGGIFGGAAVVIGLCFLLAKLFA